MRTVAVRCAGPGQQLAGAQLGLTPAAHPVDNERTLVLGDGSADLEHELVVGVITDWPVEELHRTVSALEFFEQQHLVNVVSGQAIGRREQYQIEGAEGRLVTEMVEARTFEFGPTEAVITEDMLGSQAPVRLSSHIVPQACQLLLYRVGLLLATCRDSGIQCDSHSGPPEEREVLTMQKQGQPSEAGVDRRDPTAVAHQDGERWCGGQTRGVSSHPPA